MKSVLQSERKCYCCGTTRNLDEHHIFNGNPQRKLSEKYGAKIYLCRSCHEQVHASADARLYLKQEAQRELMRIYGWNIEDFREVFFKNYL